MKATVIAVLAVCVQIGAVTGIVFADPIFWLVFAAIRIGL